MVDRNKYGCMLLVYVCFVGIGVGVVLAFRIAGSYRFLKCHYCVENSLISTQALELGAELKFNSLGNKPYEFSA